MISICIYLGSGKNIPQIYHNQAEHLGKLIAQRGDKLVFGGNESGLMKTLATTARDHGAPVLGIIPKLMATPNEINSENLIITPDMQERKRTMQNHADAFIVLPGGIGTLEEFFETLTLKYLKSHNKPIVLLNTDNFFTPLLNALKLMTTQNFIKPDTLNLYQLSDTPQQALNLIDQQLK